MRRFGAQMRGLGHERQIGHHPFVWHEAISDFSPPYHTHRTLVIGYIQAFEPKT